MVRPVKKINHGMYAMVEIYHGSFTMVRVFHG